MEVSPAPTPAGFSLYRSQVFLPSFPFLLSPFLSFSPLLHFLRLSFSSLTLFSWFSFLPPSLPHSPPPPPPPPPSPPTHTRTRSLETHRGVIKKLRFAPGKGNYKLLVLYHNRMETRDTRSHSSKNVCVPLLQCTVRSRYGGGGGIKHPRKFYPPPPQVVGIICYK